MAKSGPSGSKQKQTLNGTRWKHIPYKFYRLGTEISRAVKARLWIQINSQNWKQQQQQQKYFWENVDMLPAKEFDYYHFPSGSDWGVSCLVIAMKLETFKATFQWLP